MLWSDRGGLEERKILNGVVELRSLTSAIVPCVLNIHRGSFDRGWQLLTEMLRVGVRFVFGIARQVMRFPIQTGSGNGPSLSLVFGVVRSKMAVKLLSIHWVLVT
jgi:hypothetical protein